MRSITGKRISRLFPVIRGRVQLLKVLGEIPSEQPAAREHHDRLIRHDFFLGRFGLFGRAFVRDGRAALVAILFADLHQLFFNHGKQLLFAFQDALQRFNEL